MKRLKLFVLTIMIFLTVRINAQWNQCDGTYGGDILCLAISGNNIFAGTYLCNGGWQSTNNGQSWSQSLAIHNYIECYAVSGNNIFAGTDGWGVYHSTDNGQSWSPSGLDVEFIYSLAISGNNVFAGTAGGGVFVSTNNGTNWIHSSGFDTLPAQINALAISGNNIFAGIPAYGVYISTNNGYNWFPTGLNNRTINSLAVSGNYIYAGTTPYGVYFSTDNGQTWTQTSLNNKKVYSLAISGNNIFAGTYLYGVYLSTDNGQTWTQTTLNNKTVNTITSSGNKLYAGTDRYGVYLSTNNGQTWTQTAFNTQYIYTFTGIGSNLFTGTGFGMIFHSSNNGQNWLQTAGFDYQINSLAYSGNNILAAMNDTGVWLSTNNGLNWSQTALNNQSINSVIYSGNNILAGTTYNGVYLSTNNGINWTQTTLNNYTVWSFAISGNNIFAGTAAGVWLSTNNGQSWSQTSMNPTIVWSLAISGNYIFAATGPYTAFGNNRFEKIVNWGVYVSSNNGQNWTQTNLNSVTVHSLVCSGNNVIAGSIDYGVYYSTDKGANWNSGNQGFFTTPSVYSLFISDNYVFAGTGGYSVWRRPLNDLLGLPVTISGQILFQDNNQPVNSGCVKALKYDYGTNQILTVDSTQIQSNGTYSLNHIPPQDSLYIMAFENDEAMLVFVPTYYPSTTNWQNAAVLYPIGNLSNINVLVYRINNTGGPYHISGHIFENTGNPLLGLNQSVVYAKVGNDFKAYSISDFSGLYRIDSLPSATYSLIADRIGYSPMNRSVLISNYSKDSIDITFNMVGVVHREKDMPKSYVLENNYPNPFNPETKIAFGIPHASNTKLIIYDILGREIATLINEKLEAGNYNVEWNAGNYSSGIYFYKLESGDFVQTKKMVLIK